MNPKYPIYIISKGRWDSRLTSKALEKMDIPYHIVVEPQEYDNYAAVIDPDKIYTLPFSNLGQGSIPARNWVWEHSISTGAERHWILDDNIGGFRRRMAKNERIRVKDGSIFCACEDFTDRYENVALSGMNYRFFGGGTLTSKTAKNQPVFYLNTRIYSCILVKNDIPYRWRGKYNEDTDLSLRVLKDGWCTILFNTFLCVKRVTLSMRGGNTDELYAGTEQGKLENDGRYLMAKSLYNQHLDVVKIIRKWGRWQHHVDYRPFKNNRLIKKEGLIIPEGMNNYGMKLVKKTAREQ